MKTKLLLLLIKTSFYYRITPFELKNACATDQCLVNKIFKNQIGQNMKVYVDDMLVKSKVTKTHIDNFWETLTTLWRYQMKLNSTKYTFGVASGKFLGFMISSKWVEANLEKIKVINDMRGQSKMSNISLEEMQLSIDSSSGWTNDISHSFRL